MSAMVKKYLSYIVVIIFAWLNGTFIKELVNGNYTGNHEYSLLWDSILEPLFWGHLVNLFSIFLSSYILLNLHFKDINIDKRVPYLAMWSTIMLTIVLFAVGFMKYLIFNQSK